MVKLANRDLISRPLLAGADPNLRDPACGLTVTHDAAREGFTDSVRVLLEHGADANIVDAQGNLPLHLAAREGHLDTVRLLLERTADPGAANAQGQSAQRLALLHHRGDVARLLQADARLSEYPARHHSSTARKGHEHADPANISPLPEIKQATSQFAIVPLCHFASLQLHLSLSHIACARSRPHSEK